MSAKNVADERMALGQARDLCPLSERAWAARSCRIPAAATGTARNMNSVAKLAELAKEME